MTSELSYQESAQGTRVEIAIDFLLVSVANSEVIRVRFGLAQMKSHSLYAEILGCPPSGVVYRTGYTFSESGSSRLDDYSREPFARRINRNEVVRSLVERAFATLLPRGAVASSSLQYASAHIIDSLSRLTSPEYVVSRADFDVFHSAGSSMMLNIPWIIRNNVNWVVDFEFVGSLFGYLGDWRRRIYDHSARRVLARQLESRFCRKLMPWTNAARAGLAHVLGTRTMNEKTEVVRLAIRPASPRPGRISSHDSVRILFVGSINYGSEFWSKGGLEVLESYRLLRESLGPAVELWFRCWIPPELQHKYENTPGLHMILGALPRNDLDELFWQSDVFLFPSHNTPGLAFLDAMRFGLPVVAKNIWANSEIVKNGITGFLVEPSGRIPYYLPGFIPNWSMDSGPFLPYMRFLDRRVVDDLVDALTRLAENPLMRHRMGEIARREIEEGAFSIGRRNIQLKRIYEESLRR